MSLEDVNKHNVETSRKVGQCHPLTEYINGPETEATFIKYAKLCFS